jgi:hypothetical protein
LTGLGETCERPGSRTHLRGLTDARRHHPVTGAPRLAAGLGHRPAVVALVLAVPLLAQGYRELRRHQGVDQVALQFAGGREAACQVIQPGAAGCPVPAAEVERYTSAVRADWYLVAGYVLAGLGCSGSVGCSDGSGRSGSRAGARRGPAGRAADSLRTWPRWWADCLGTAGGDGLLAVAPAVVVRRRRAAAAGGRGQRAGRPAAALAIAGVRRDTSPPEIARAGELDSGTAGGPTSSCPRPWPTARRPPCRPPSAVRPRRPAGALHRRGRARRPGGGQRRRPPRHRPARPAQARWHNAGRPAGPSAGRGRDCAWAAASAGVGHPGSAPGAPARRPATGPVLGVAGHDRCLPAGPDPGQPRGRVAGHTGGRVHPVGRGGPPATPRQRPADGGPSGRQRGATRSGGVVGPTDPGRSSRVGSTLLPGGAGGRRDPAPAPVRPAAGNGPAPFPAPAASFTAVATTLLTWFRRPGPAPLAPHRAAGPPAAAARSALRWLPGRGPGPGGRAAGGHRVRAEPGSSGRCTPCWCRVPCSWPPDDRGAHRCRSGAGPAGVLVGAGFLIDQTWLSLHPFYRRRLACRRRPTAAPAPWPTRSRSRPPSAATAAGPTGPAGHLPARPPCRPVRPRRPPLGRVHHVGRLRRRARRRLGPDQHP